jgi:hypothetical protein
MAQRLAFSRQKGLFCPPFYAPAQNTLNFRHKMPITMGWTPAKPAGGAEDDGR